MLRPGDPHLLMIPREIRDQIYTYIHRELRFDINLFDAGMRSTINAILTNAPYVSLLVVHSRFYCEYREAHLFKDLHLHLIQSPEGIYSSGPGPSEQDFTALARAVSATIHTRPHRRPRTGSDASQSGPSNAHRSLAILNREGVCFQHISSKRVGSLSNCPKRCCSAFSRGSTSGSTY